MIIYAYKEPLAELWNIDESELPKLLSFEEYLCDTVDTIIKPFLDDESFGGTSVDTTQNKLIIYTVNNSKVEPLKLLPEVKPYVDFLQFKEVSNPTANLNAKFDRVVELSEEYEAFGAFIFTDVSRNNVVIMIFIENERKNKNFLRAVESESLNPVIIFMNDTNQHASKPQKRDPHPIMLLGEGIYNKDNEGCTVSFFAKNKTNPNQTYMITAGHCTFDEEEIFYDGRKIGKTILVNTDPFDYALIEITDGNIKPTAIIKNTKSTRYKDLFIKDVRVPSCIGVHLCKSGALSQVTCGRAISLDVYYTLFGEINRFFLSDLFSIEGDSGSPVFSYSPDLRTVILSGIVTGGAQMTTVTSVKEILEHGNLELVTHAGLNNAYKEPLAELWNIDESELPKLLSFEENLCDTVDTIIKPFLDDESFGGTYVDTTQNKLIIYTVNYSKVEPLKLLPEVKPYVDFLQFKEVSNPTANLNAKFDRIVELSEKYKAFSVFIFTDVSRNNVVIMMFIDNKRKNEKFLRAVESESLNPVIIFMNDSNQHASKPQKRDLHPIMLLGEGIYNKDNEGCTVSFFAKDKTNPNQTYMITAGHCTFDEEEIFYDGRKIGKTILTNSDPFDYALIEITDDNIKPTASIKNTKSTRYKELYIKDVRVPSCIGVHLCKSGALSQVTCGRAISLDVYYTLGYGAINRYFLSDLFSIEGDSGSPVFSYSPDLRTVILSGIVDGGGTQMTTVTSVKEILEHGSLELVTHAGLNNL